MFRNEVITFKTRGPSYIPNEPMGSCPAKPSRELETGVKLFTFSALPNPPVNSIHRNAVCQSSDADNKTETRNFTSSRV